MDSRIWAERIASKEILIGPLTGMRLAVKDMFDIAGHITRAGNPDWASTHPVPEQTAVCVQQLCRAGAQLVGKTQTDELAYSLNGANVHYGTPLNPAAPDRLPGGSSSGSAVAVAKGDADIGLGTDTGGSIRVPSSYCGLYGFRPSWGTIDIAGTVPLAPRFDTVGFMCRTPSELGRVGDVLLPTAEEVPSVDGVYWLAPEGFSINLALINDRCTQMHLPLKGQHALTRAFMVRASDAFRILQGRAIWRTHGAWITSTQPRFASDIAVRFQWASTLTDADEQWAQQYADSVTAQLRQWSENGRYVLALPSTPGAAPLLSLQGEALTRYRESLMGMTALAGLWGAAVLAAPWLHDQQAPWGVSFVAAPGQDRCLLKAVCTLV